MAGLGQTISKLGTFFEKYVPHSMPIFEKRSHPMEGLKLCLDFLCNVRKNGDVKDFSGSFLNNKTTEIRINI